MADIRDDMDRLQAAVTKKQGGTNRGAGMDSAKDPARCGDVASNPSTFTTQEDQQDQGGGPKNKFLPV